MDIDSVQLIPHCLPCDVFGLKIKQPVTIKAISSKVYSVFVHTI